MQTKFEYDDLELTIAVILITIVTTVINTITLPDRGNTDGIIT